MQIDLLYFDGCPSWRTGLENLQLALEHEGIEAEIRPVRVEDDVQATALKFMGSPSFLVNGQDWWPEERTTYHLNCRLYSTPAGMRGAPSVEMFQEKIKITEVVDV